MPELSPVIWCNIETDPSCSNGIWPMTEAFEYYWCDGEDNMHMNDVRMRASESFFGPKL